MRDDAASLLPRLRIGVEAGTSGLEVVVAGDNVDCQPWLTAGSDMPSVGSAFYSGAFQRNASAMAASASGAISR